MVIVAGDDLGSLMLRESVMRAEQITCPSLAWLLPSPLFWKPSEVLVQTDKFNYTINDLQKLFTLVLKTSILNGGFRRPFLLTEWKLITVYHRIRGNPDGYVGLYILSSTPAGGEGEAYPLKPLRLCPRIEYSGDLGGPAGSRRFDPDAS